MKYKVGDKVKAKEFGEGIVCHISGGIDYVHVRTNKHGVIFVRIEDLEKLPKYAIGDVVRANGKITIIESVGTLQGVITYGVCGVAWALTEDNINPFDGFQIGDRVWTPKRGFGLVTDLTTSKKRPYRVCFDADGEGFGFPFRTPKRENIESEEYGKMMVKLAKKIDAKAVKVLHEEIVRPKFKVGDIVYYESKTTGKPGKYEVTSVYPDLSLRLVGAQNNPAVCLMVDHELVRPWVPTRITHNHRMEEMPLGGFLCENVPESKFSFAGKHISGMDIIFEHDPRGIEVWYGINGDDI